MTTVIETDRDLWTLIREQTYRSLMAYTGHNEAADTYHTTLFSFTPKELHIDRYPPAEITWAGLFVDEIDITERPDLMQTGGERWFETDFSIVILPGQKVAEKDAILFINKHLSYLNTWFQSFPKMEGLFGLLHVGHGVDNYQYKEQRCGCLPLHGVIIRVYTVATEL